MSLNKKNEDDYCKITMGCLNPSTAPNYIVFYGIYFLMGL